MNKKLAIILIFVGVNFAFAQDSTKTNQNDVSVSKISNDTINVKINQFFKGQADAKKYYKNSTGAVLGTLGVGLLSPLVALIPAIATSAKTPKDQNLGYPDGVLFKNEEYKRGYSSQAKKMKQGRVWGVWGGSLIVAVIVQALKKEDNIN